MRERACARTDASERAGAYAYASVGETGIIHKALVRSLCVYDITSKYSMQMRIARCVYVLVRDLCTESLCCINLHVLKYCLCAQCSVIYYDPKRTNNTL